MEYGYNITDTSGNERFFVEGCTNCLMSTGGLHEASCPSHDEQMKQGYIEMADENLKIAEEFLPILPTQREIAFLQIYKVPGYI